MADNKSLDMKSLNKLQRAIEASYKELSPFREASYETIQQYTGAHYGQNKEDQMKPVPLNYIQLAADIYVQNIAPIAPKFLARAKKVGLKQSVLPLEMALNHLSKEILLNEVLKEAVTNAIFSMGIIKVGTAETDRGTVIDETQPYAESVSMNDFVYDTTAKKFTQCTFVCDRVFVDMETFKESGLYDKKYVDLVPAYKPYGEENSTNPTNPHELSGDPQRTDEFREVVELWEVFLPFDNLVVTIPVCGKPYPLRVVEWQGGEKGPYHLLRFSDVPDNIMPIAPASTWRDIHELANDVMIKIRNQAQRQKTILGFGLGAKEDAQKIVNAGDGDAVGVADPTQMKEFKFGGAEQINMATIPMTRDMFSWLGGNIDMLGGLSAQADTLGQEQLMGINSSKRMIKLKQSYQTFCQSVGESLADELWYNPNIDMPMVKEYPSGIQIPFRFNEEIKEGDFIDYNIDIDPYSVSHMTPGERLQQISGLMQQFFLPMMPFIQQQGGSINTMEMIEMVARYSNNPELMKLIVFADQPSESEFTKPIEPGEGAKSQTKVNIRKNIPTGGTRQFRDQQFSLAAMGQNTQPKEQEASTRIGAY